MTNKLKATRVALYTSIVALSVIGTLFLSGCKDFFGTEDLRQQIQEQVDVAQAEPLKITVQAASDTLGITTPYGTYTCKQGIAFDVKTTVGADYTFLEWTHNGEEGDITFEDATQATTKATVHVIKEDLQIIPTFDRRPYVVFKMPEGDNIERNQSIILTFNEPINNNSIVITETGTIQITEVPINDYTALPIHIESKFDSLVTNNTLTLSLKTDELYNPLRIITVKLSVDISDLSNNNMADETLWYFQTGSTSDITGPSIESFDAYNLAGTVINSESDNGYTKDNSIIIEVLASDKNTITGIQFIETAWTSGYSSGEALGEIITHPKVDFTEQVPFTLTTTSDGWTKLEVLVFDKFNNPSIISDTSQPNAIYIYRDSIAPVIDTFQIASGNGFTNTTTPAVSISSSDAGSGDVQYALSETSNLPANWISTVPNSVSITSGDGNKTIYLHVIDAIGNWDYTSENVVLDTIKPSFLSADISGTGNPGFIRNNQKIIIQFMLTEDTSGISENPSVTIAGQSALLTLASFPNYIAEYSFSGTTLTQGEIMYTIDAHDSAGNAMDTRSASTNIVYDRDAPILTIIDPASDISINHTATLVFTGAAVSTEARIGTTGTWQTFSSGNQISSLSDWDSTADGSISVELRSTDEAGNTGILNRDFVKDTTPPNLQFSSPLTDAPINQNAAIVFTGAELTSEARIGTSGTWQTFSSGHSISTLLEWAGTSEGTIKVEIRSTDAAGNLGTISRNFVKDVSAPTLSISGPIDNAPVSATATLTFSGAEVSTEARIGSSGTWQAFSSGSQISSLFDWTSTADGSIIVELRSTDEAGNIGSTNRSFIKDTTPPTLQFNSPLANAPVNQIASITFTGAEVSSEARIGAEGTWQTFVSGSLISSLSDWAGANEDTITFEIRSIDSAGNISTASRNFVKDITAPTLLISGPVDNAAINANATLTFTGTEGTSEARIGTEGTWQTFTSSNLFSSLADWDSAADGTITVEIRSSDQAGNLGTTSRSFVKDIQKPTISIDSITSTGNPEYVKNEQKIVIQFTLYDATSGIVDPPSIQIAGQNATLTDSSYPDYSAEYSFSGTTLDQGEIFYTINAMDYAGNAMNSHTASTAITYDRDAPVLAITNPNIDAPINSISALVFSGAEVTSEARIGTEGTWQTFTSGNLFSSLADWDSAIDGTITVEIRSADHAGNLGTTSRSFVKDVQKPTISIGSITTTGNPGYVKNEQKIVIQFTLNDTTSGIVDPPSVKIAGQNATLTDSSYPDYSAEYSFSGTTLDQGEVNYTIDAIDNAGNAMVTHTASTAIIYDRDAPSAEVSTTGNRTVGKAGDVIIFTVNFTDTNLLEETPAPTFSLSGVVAATDMEKVGSLEWAFTLTVPADMDIYEAAVSIHANDAAGNSLGSLSGQTVFTIDNTAPSVSSIVFADNTLNVAGASSLVTITFSEDVSNFTVADITAPNGTLGALSGSGDSYSITFTAAAATEAASNTFEIGTAYTDLAGNAGTAGSASYSIDTLAPSVSSIVFADNTLNVAGASSLVTITFSEDVSNFTVADITAPNGTLGALSGSGDSYSITFTAAAATEAASNTFEIGTAYTDLSGNAGTAGSASYSIDTIAPSDTTAAPTATANATGGVSGGTVTLSWAFPDTDRDSILISWASDEIILDNPLDTEYTTPVLTAGRAYTFTIRAIDSAGNLSSGSSSNEVTATASAVTMTGVSAASGLLISFTGTFKNLYYWTGERIKPSLEYNIATNPEGYHVLSNPTSGVELTNLVTDQTFSACFASASGVFSMTYTFVWSGSAYAAATTRSISQALSLSTTPSGWTNSSTIQSTHIYNSATTTNNWQSFATAPMPATAAALPQPGTSSTRNQTQSPAATTPAQQPASALARRQTQSPALTTPAQPSASSSARSPAQSPAATTPAQQPASALARSQTQSPAATTPAQQPASPAARSQTQSPAATTPTQPTASSTARNQTQPPAATTPAPQPASPTARSQTQSPAATTPAPQNPTPDNNRPQTPNPSRSGPIVPEAVLPSANERKEKNTDPQA